ncbi:MAG TPA: SurA N-terminal domain-containing protein, partial [Gemmataceae bacterium]|nr:SurA N-terminal domain-containing protein [Gemmataceae bacterium]
MRLTLIIVIALTLTGEAAAKGKVVANVNGESIGLDEVDTALQQRPRQAPLTAAEQRQQRQEVLSGMIDDLLMRQFLRQHGPKVDQSEIDQAFAALETSQKTQGRTLAEYLKESKQTEAQVRTNIQTMLQMVKYVNASTTEEVLRKYHEQNRDFFDRTTVRVSHILLRTGRSAGMDERRKARQKLEALRAQITTGRLE